MDCRLIGLVALVPALGGCVDGVGSSTGGPGATDSEAGGSTSGGAGSTAATTSGGPETGSGEAGDGGTADGNAAPRAEDDYRIAQADEVLEIPADDGLLLNDVDDDGDEIWVDDAPVTTWMGGALEVMQDGSFRYTPPEDYGGCDGFSYGVTDGTDAATADVHLAVAHPFKRPSPVRLSRVAQGWGGLALDGEIEGDRSGRTVAFAGDVDGNAVPDVMIGAPQASPDEEYAGRVYVAFGLLNSDGLDLAGIGDGDAGFVVDGEGGDPGTGDAIAGAGDVNGDGLDDLLIGAWETNAGGGPMGDVVGRTFVVFGKVDQEPVELANVHAGEGGFSITGAMMADFSGADVDGGGDVNGDGLADVIVGAPFSDPHGPESGRAYVVYGKSDGTPVSLAEVDLGIGGFAIEGEAAQDFAGNAVANAGDFNGDGFDDVVVGAGNAFNDRGRVYLVFGKADAAAVDLRDVNDGVGGFVIDGEEPDDRAGWSVSGVRDVNGDGLADFAFGAYGADAQRGRTYIVFGRSDGVVPAITDLLVDGGLVIEGEASGDFSGAALSTAGDINGDGLGDIAIGAWRADSELSLAGRAYVVFGRPQAGRVELSDVADGLGGFAIEGEDQQGFAGRSIGGGGDVDGDGVDDIIVGAYGVHDYAGRTYVIHGGVLACPD